jgi:hypothetical protein
MKRIALLAGLCVACLAIVVIAQGAITVKRAVVCTAVVDREPSGADSTFADSVSTLCCFTELDGAAGQVVHSWYHGDSLRFELTLDKGGEGRWRTWSKKTMMKEWTGAWRVDIKDTAGSVLKSVSFEYGK